MAPDTSPTHPDGSRRSLLAVGAGSLLAGTATAQPAAVPGAAHRPRGPAVWLDLDQAELDRAYDQVQYAPNQPLVLQRFAALSNGVRERIGMPQRVAYGPTPVEMLDIHRTARPHAPVHVFIHGGAWRGGLAKDYAFPAEMFVNAGVHYVVPDFVAVGAAEGNSLLPMAEQVRRAIAWVHRNATRFGGDPDRIFLSGHSSGAHLAGAALVTDWRREFDAPAEVVKGALLCSGLYDLKAPRLSARSSYVRFTDAMEEALSTQRHLARIQVPVVLAHGTLETPEFQRQTRDFAAALRAAGKPVELLVGESYNHFEIAETLGHPYGLLGRAALGQMGLRG